MRLSLGIEGSRLRSRGVQVVGATFVVSGLSVPLTASAQTATTAAPPPSPEQPAPVPSSAPIDAPALAAQPAPASSGASGATPSAAPGDQSAAAAGSGPAPGPAPAPAAAPTQAPPPYPTAPAETNAAQPSAQPGADPYATWDGRYAAYPPGPYRQPRYYKQQVRYRGIYVQPRIMGTFGVNFPHQFAEECPGLSCDVDSPAGFAGGALVGWGWKNTGVHLLVMGMFDTFGVDVELPPVEAVDGGASGEAGGGFSFDIDDDGVSIDGSLFGDGDAGGSASDDEEPGDAHATRSGVAFGAGIQHAWFRRPVRLSTGLSAGAVRRTVKGSSGILDSRAEYTAPFIMGDIGFAFGRRKSFMIGAMAFVEFAPKVRLERNGVFRNVPVITEGPQVFVGPYLAIQWGPKGRPVQPQEEYDDEEEVYGY